MTGPRRVVTGTDADGRSTVLSDGAAPGGFTIEAGGLGIAQPWDVPLPPPDPEAGGDPPEPVRFLPAPATLRSFRLTLPPAAVTTAVDREAYLAEIQRKAPDTLALFDPSRGPGMHRTDSVDLVIVASGTPVLVLEAKEVPLEPGDWVVQQGTWHAWRNPGDEPAVLAGVLIRCG